MNPDDLRNYIHGFWDSEIVPTLVDYIKIPNKSPSFDPDWEKHGHMDNVLSLCDEKFIEENSLEACMDHEWEHIYKVFNEVFDERTIQQKIAMASKNKNYIFKKKIQPETKFQGDVKKLNANQNFDHILCSIF